jgi:hypothetical protein
VVDYLNAGLRDNSNVGNALLADLDALTQDELGVHTRAAIGAA